ncbi:BamA/TamA family outer membrane protein [candidate division KSB1 bacterium]|nr:BamA/TamA family outer membrane protein [candidate division KSB1 bacterium]
MSCRSFFAFLCVFIAGFASNPCAPSLFAAEFIDDDSNEVAIDKLQQKYDFVNAKKMSGDCEIPEDEHLVGTIVAQEGTLLIRGHVQGDVVVLYGDIELAQSGRVDGDVVSLDGKIWRHRDAIVAGDLIEIRSEKFKRMRLFSDDSVQTIKPWMCKRDREKGREEPWFEYNRVDGLTLGLVLPSIDWWYAADHSFALFGRLGYAFKPKKVHYQAGLEKRISRALRLSVGAEAHRWTQTEDRWIMDDLENTVVAILLREDFRDYYGLEGYSLYASSRSKALRLTAGYFNEELRNLPKRTDWSVFGGNKRFRNNPEALHQAFGDTEQGSAANLQSYRLGFEWNTRSDEPIPAQGWWITGLIERSGKGLKSDYEFERVILDLRRYQNLNWDERVVFRLRAGSTAGLIPPAYAFDLGGLSTMRGYRFKEFSGNRMVLGNLEYWFNTADQNEGFWGQWVYIVFVDAGAAWFTDDDPSTIKWPIAEQECNRSTSRKLTEGFGSLSWSALKTDVGIALAGRDDHWRINFAKRTDRGGNDFCITFRIQREI